MHDIDMGINLKKEGWNVLINTDGHSKFWAFIVSDSSVRVRWGKIGTCGQEQKVDGENSFNYIFSKVSEKLRKGYRWASNPQDAKLIPDEVKILWEM